MDPVLHAQMTALMKRKKELEGERAQLDKDLPLWQKRVELARSKGMSDLARQAQEKLDELRRKDAENRTQFDIIDQEKDMLRYQARRPSGEEVARAEHMLDQVRMGGLVDPDKAKMERELNDLVSFDFEDEER